MSIKFNAEEKADLISRLQDYCDAELDRELGSFEAQFMLDFISDTTITLTTVVDDGCQIRLHLSQLIFDLCVVVYARPSRCPQHSG